MPQISSYAIDSSLDGTEKLLSSGSGTTQNILVSDLNDFTHTNVDVITFQMPNTTATMGTINIDWSAIQNYHQQAPAGDITYTFTNPSGPCRPSLVIEPKASGVATFTWPGSLIWLEAAWAPVAGKKAVISFLFDGTNWFASGMNEA